MSQIRVDKTNIIAPNVVTLRDVVMALAKKHGGRIETEAAYNYDKNKTEKSDCGIVYFDTVVHRGIAVVIGGGLTFRGDPYGYVEGYNDRTRAITTGLLDAEVEAALRTAQFVSVTNEPVGRSGKQFIATDRAGRKATIIRDGEGKLRTTFDGYEGRECESAQKAIATMLAARGIVTETEKVEPKSDEKWHTQRLLAMNN